MENLEDRVAKLERENATLKKDLNQLGVGLAQLLTGLIHDLTPPRNITHLTPTTPTYLSVGEILANEVLANNRSHRSAEEEDPNPHQS